MARYLAILYTRPDRWAPVSREEMTRIMMEYRAWREGLTARGHFLDGHKLTDDTGRVMRQEDGALRVLDGPFSESKEVVGGYFAIQADGYDHAVRLFSDCPHLGYGGTIEIRELDEPR